MPLSRIQNQPNDYNTTINVIGGISDVGIIHKMLETCLCNSVGEGDAETIEEKLGLRTERSRTRVLRAVREGFLSFHNQDHKSLIEGVYKNNISMQEKELVLFWQFALNNRLFREISAQLYCKVYISGRAGITKEDVSAYLSEFVSKNRQADLKWTNSTIDTLASKYLNFLTKLNFLEGARRKTFRSIKPTAEVLVLFLYFARLHEPLNSNILNNEFLPLSFIHPQDISQKLKKLSIKGFFNMNFNGVALNVELTHGYERICDVLYNRS